MALTYREVSDIYKELRDAGALDKTLPEFSAEMGRITGTDTYAAGLSDNWIKRASVGLDRLVESTGAVDVGGFVGNKLGDLIGEGEMGESVGRGLPRGFVNFLPMLVSRNHPAGVAATAALTGAQTYTDTGSAGAGVLSGATAGTMPMIAKGFGQLALRALGAPVVEGSISQAISKGVPMGVQQLSTRLPQNLTQGVLSQLAEQGGAAAYGEMSRMGEATLDPNSEYDFDPKRILLENTIGQLPFAVTQLSHGGRAAFGGETTRKVEADLRDNVKRTTEALQKLQQQTEAKASAPVTRMPTTLSPAETATLDEANARLGLLLGRKAESKDPVSTDTLNRELEDLRQEQFDRTQGVGVLDGLTTVPTKSARRVGVVGHFDDVAKPKSGKSRIFVVADDAANRDAGVAPGRYNVSVAGDYGNALNPRVDPAGSGLVLIDFPPDYSHQIVDRKQAEQQFAEAHPELPVQPGSDAVGKLREDWANMRQVHEQVRKAVTPEEIVQAKQAFNAALRQANLPEYDDARLDRELSIIRQANRSATTTDAVRAVMQRTERRLAKQEALVREQQEQAGREDAFLGSLLEARTAPEGRPETDVVLANELAQRQESFANTPDKFRKTVWEWDKAGRPGGLDGLDNRLGEKERSRVKEKVPVTPETRPVLEDRVALADALAEREAALHPERSDDYFAWRNAVEEGADPAALPHITELHAELEDLWARLGDKGEPARAFRNAPFVAQTQQDLDTIRSWGFEGGRATGDALVRAATTDPVLGGLAQDFLTRFPELLNRVDAQVVTMDGESYAMKLPDGRVRLHIADNLLHTSPEVQRQEIMHELVHGLTLHMIDDPVRGQEVEALRERVLKAAPKDIQEAVARVQSADFISRFNKGETTDAELHPDPEKRSLVYGLLNGREFLSQGFTSEPVRQFLQSIKLDGKTSGWQAFKNFVKDLLGFGNRIKGTAFDEFLDRSHTLLMQGEAAARFRNYGEAYLQDMGVPEGRARAQTQRAMGLLTELKWKGDVFDALSRFDLESQARLERTRQQVDEAFANADAEGEPVRGILSEMGFDPTSDGVDQMVDAAFREGADISDAMLLLPHAVSQHVANRVADAREVLDVLRAATGKDTAKLVDVANPTEVRKPVAEALRAVDKVGALEEVQEQSLQMLRDMMGISPDNFAAKALRQPEKAAPFLGEPPEALTGFQQWFSQMGRVARSNPVTAEFINKGFLLQANARRMLGSALKVLGVDLESGRPELTPEGLDSSIKGLANPKVEKAADRWIAHNQFWAKDQSRKLGQPVGVQMRPLADPEVQQLLTGLSQSERTAVIDLVNKFSYAKQAMDKQVEAKVKEEGLTHAARVVVADAQVKASEGLRIAKALDEALDLPPGPAQDQAIMAVQQQMASPQGWLDLVQTTQKNRQILGEYQKFHAENPAMASGQRQQKFLVHFTAGGKRKLGQADNKAQAEQYVREAGGDIRSMRLEENAKGSGEDFPTLGPDAGEVVQRLADLEENHMQWLRDKGYLSQEGWDEWGQMSAARQFAREAANTGGGLPGFKAPPRNLSKGAEHLPWMRNQISWAQRQSNYWTRRLFRAQGELHLNEPDIAGNPELRQQLKTWQEALLRNDPQSVALANRLTGTWFMGFNPATALSNGVQTLITLAPELTRANGGRVLDSLSRWKRAVGEVVGHFATFDKKNRWRTPEREQFMKEATRDGEVDFSQYDQDAIANEAITTKYLQVMDAKKPQTMGQRLSKAAGAFSSAAFLPFRAVEKFNHYVTLISAFDLAKHQGKSFEEAKQFAYEINRAVNYGGGRAQRPVAPFSGKDPFSRSVAMLATNMQSYNLGVLGQIGQYLREGAFRPKGLTPAEVYASRKALVQMMGTQFAAAGLLGMPFVSAIVAGLDKMFPDLEVAKHIREGVAGFFSDDKENNGSAWSDMALTGMPSMLGWDMQSRLSMGNLLPGVSEYNGFQPEGLLGPPYALLSNFVRGASELSQKGSTDAFVPPGVKRLWQLTQSDGMARDYLDRPVFELTPGEKVGMTLGFQPKRLSDYNVASRLATQADRLANDREGLRRQAMAEEVLAGNYGSVRQQLLGQLRSEPGFDAEQAIRGIARAAEELHFPQDLRRAGGTKAGSSVLEAVNLPQSRPQEVQRLLFRYDILRKLGLMVSPSATELRRAQLLDQLRMSSPSATRRELQRQADSLLSRERVSPLLLE